MSVPAYPAYKRSGVEWLGEIPAGWQVKPLKHVASFVNGEAFKPSEWSDQGTPIIRIQNLNGGEDFNYYDGEVEPRYHIQRGDLLFGWSGNRGTSFGPFVWMRSGLHYLNQHIFKVLPGDCNSDWLHWCLRAVTLYVEQQAHGIIGMVHVTQGALGSIPVPVPTGREQSSIAAFLDRETGKIDALVAEQVRLMALLKEKRQAVISHAVTRGLDPNAPMKDSGVEWLGQVPTKWGVKRLKQIAGGITVGVVVMPTQYYADVGVPALRSLNVKEMAISLDSLVYFDPKSNEILSKSVLRSDDLVAVRTGKPGTTAVVTTELEGANCIDLILIRRSDRYISRFVAFVMNSEVCRIQYEMGSEGAIQQHFNIATAGNIMLAVPPIPEQRAIVAFLDIETGRLDSLITEADNAIRLLRERRAALISAAVTGKIDVRGLSAETREAA